MLKGFFENLSDKKYIKQKEKVLSAIKKRIDQLKGLDDNDFIQHAVKLYIWKETPVEESFAFFYEGLRRVKGIEAYDVQLLGALALVDNTVAEMKTGEGKTFVAPFAAYHHAVNGRKVHLMTVNDYLAERDCFMLNSVFVFLGLTTDFLVEKKQNQEDRKKAYEADVIYGKPSEFAFDYLRDHLIFEPNHKVQTRLDCIIIDEVDSILIDESRTPMVISSLSEVNHDSLEVLFNLSSHMSVVFKEPEEDSDHSIDVFVDEKTKDVRLLNSGYDKLETVLIKENLIQDNRHLYGTDSHYILMLLNVLKAKYVYHKDHEYIVKDDKIVLIDAQTGRLKPNTRLSDGLHQAIEFKENVTVNPDAQQSGSITMVAYVTMYQYICGMTGTAIAEKETFMDLYSLPVKKIKTNKPTIRKDYQDRFCFSKKSLYECVVNDIVKHHQKKQPVLVGTQSVEESEVLSTMLTEIGLEHFVLNAKNNYKEAEIIENAGKLGSITISTSMAGRGTDILLGGPKPNDSMLLDYYEVQRQKVIEAGGLRVIGVGRNFLRRMDEQLQGRSGRQGDVGESVFYVSLDDTLIKQYSSPKFSSLLQSMTLENSDFLENSMIDRSVRSMQKKVESYYADTRKYTMRFDNIISKQRDIIFDMRKTWLNKDNTDLIHTSIYEMIEAYLESLLTQYIPSESMPEQWDIKGIEKKIADIFYIRDLQLNDFINNQKVINELLVKEYVIMTVLEKINGLVGSISNNSESFTKLQLYILRSGVLTTIDTIWKNHLHFINELQQNIGLRSYANKKPAEEFIKDSYNMFNEMLDIISEEILMNYMDNLTFVASHDSNHIDLSKEVA